MDAQARGGYSRERVCLLQAAEQLYLAAALSTGELRAARSSLARQLHAQAQALEGRADVAARSTPARSQAAAAPLTAGGDEEQAASWLVRERPDVRFADIAGLEAVKEQIRLKLLYPFTHPDDRSYYGAKPGGGILLYGPPGTGKTLLARAVAGEIDAPFFAIKPSQVMSQWVGVAEKNVAQLFAEAGSYPRSVIFIDELESISPKRRSNQSTVMARVVPQLLAEMDGFEKRTNSLLMIGATNEPWSIDVAMTRPKRFGRLVYVSPPDLAARLKILQLNLKDAPLADAIDLEGYAERTPNFSGADMAALAESVRERVFLQAVHTGDRRLIEAQDFEAVLSEMSPSIPASELERFEQYARNRALKR